MSDTTRVVESGSRLNRLTAGLIRYRVCLFLVAALLTALAIPVANRLAFDESVESLFAEDDPQLREFMASRSLFGGDEFVIVAYEDPDLFKDSGVLVSEVSEDGPAAKAGLESGDIITRLNEERVTSTSELRQAIAATPPGTEVKLDYVRESERHSVEATLAAAAEDADGLAVEVSGSTPEDDSTETQVPELSLTGLETDGMTLTERGEKRLRTFAESLSRIPGVDSENTQHLADALKFKYGRKRARKLVEDFLVGSDNKTTAIVLKLKDVNPRPKENVVLDLMARTADWILQRPTRPTQSNGTIADIRALAGAHDPPAFVVGEPVQIHDMFRMVEQDAGLLFLVSLGVLGIVIFFLFRSLRWVVLPLAVVIITIVWTEALLVFSNIRLSMVSSMLNAMVTVIGIATVTHVTVHYLDARRTMFRLRAFFYTFVELLPAIFWTCLTTAIGFAALLSSEITPVRSFGLMMALASIMVLPVIAFLLPAGFLIGHRESALQIPNQRSRLNRTLAMISGWIERHPRRLMTGGLGALFLAMPGLFLLKVETDFSKNFKESSSIVRGLNFVESRMGGAGSWEVNFPAPSPLTKSYLERVDKLTDQLRGLRNETGERALRVASVTDGLSMIPTLFALDRRLRLLNRFQNGFVTSLYNQQAGRMRIMLRGMERQPSETKLALIESAAELAQLEFGTATDSDSDSDADKSKATGIFVLLAFIIQSLLNDQLISFAWAALGISGAMTIAFRSLRIGLISLIPNVFPIVIVIGSMGWLGVPVNIGTAMIASVSMGLTVDSTIHYISAYRRARQHYDVLESLQRTNQGVGRALVYAYIALVIGFAVLTMSQFIPLVYFGVLLSLAMIGGLVGDLILLPVLLKWADSPRTPAVATAVPDQISLS